ncbi:MAG: tyrosine-type recombinase/integrase [Rhodobacteraceae bacterium]|nr:tyrosine-type recombinase/integrase [Paracoccaceae bacterium]
MIRLSDRDLAANTRSAYDRAMDSLDLFCDGRPVTDTSFVEYLEFLFANGRKLSSAKLAIAAVNRRAKRLGRPSPLGEQTDAAMEGYRRTTIGVAQAPGITWEKLDAIIAQIHRDNAGLRDIAMLRVMSDCMMRVSEVAALDVGNVGTTTIHVHRSKSDQHGEGAELFIGEPTLDAIRFWLLNADITEGPLFRPVYRDIVIPRRLSVRQIAHVIKARAGEAGFDASSHSLRVGTCQSLAEAGASLVEMQQAGRWKDPKMPAYYTRRQMAARGAVAKYRYGSAA